MNRLTAFSDLTFGILSTHLNQVHFWIAAAYVCDTHIRIPWWTHFGRWSPILFRTVRTKQGSWMSWHLTATLNQNLLSSFWLSDFFLSVSNFHALFQTWRVKKPVNSELKVGWAACACLFTQIPEKPADHQVFIARRLKPVFPEWDRTVVHYSTMLITCLGFHLDPQTCCVRRKQCKPCRSWSDGWIYFTAMKVEKGSVQLNWPNFIAESAILFRLSSFREWSCIAKAMLSSQISQLN